MTPETRQTNPAVGVREIRDGIRRDRESLALWTLLVAPLVLFVASLWIVRLVALGDTFSLTLVAPGLLVLSPLILRVPKSHLLESFARLRWEFGLLALIVILSLLSLVNSDSPIRAFRIVYPSLLPFAIYAHLTVVGYYQPRLLRWPPLLLIATALVFSTLPLLSSFVLPPLKSFLFGEYRMRGFLENSIQHSIALGVVLPLTVHGYLASTRLAARVGWGFVVLLLAFTLFQAGSKTAMAVSFSFCVLLYGIFAVRSGRFSRVALAGAVLTGLGLFLYFFGFPIAEMLNPVIAEKLRSILEGGLSNYQSIESRKILWREAIAQGRAHWLVGSGAGEKVYGMSHAHNLVLDYFKGIGVFGAAAIALLCLIIVGRPARQTGFILRGRGDSRDVLAAACLLVSVVYVICNQMSDCFGPSTVGFLWTVYLAGVSLQRGIRAPRCR